MKRGRIPDPELEKAFKRIRTGRNSDEAKCKHCFWTGVWQTNNLRSHLSNTCSLYKTQLSMHRSVIVSRTPSRSEQHEFKASIAFSCYVDNLSFTTFDVGKAIRESYRKINPLLAFPSRREIATTLLDAQYERTSMAIQTLIRSEPFLNFSLDESTNIRRERIQNLCINCPSYGAFYQLSESLEDRTMNARSCADWAIQAMEDAKGDRPWSELNSLVMDTCATQMNSALLISQFPNLKHLFIIGCDSHGLQLLVKDIIQKSRFREVFNQAQDVVQAFSTSPKQLAILRQHMASSIGGVRSFALSVITRWGSQVRMLRSMLRAIIPLRLYYTSIPKDAGMSIQKHQSHILDEKWWEKVKEILKILAPLDESIKMSESDSSCIHYVIPRWKRLQEHLQQYDVISKEAFEKRFKRQTNDCHIMAYLLNPNTIGDNSIPGFEEGDWRQRAYAFFVHHRVDPIPAMKELEEFRTKTGRFNPSFWCWTLSESPATFWANASPSSPTIGPLAIRLMKTPATAVPSERSFSVLNLVHNKLRNRLTTSRVDKLQYIYINERIMKKIKGNYNAELHLDENQLEAEVELVELEDRLIAIGECGGEPEED
jgi:hypothetical protein